MKPHGPSGRHPTTIRRKSPVTTTLLERRTRALQRHLPLAAKGDVHGLHQARVASRRLREAMPVLTAGVKNSKAGKARRKIRRLTRALGTVRELDVTVQILDELAIKPGIPRPALEDVRAHVLRARDESREMMIARLQDVNSAKLGRRLASVATVLEASGADTWREALATRVARRAKRFTQVLLDAGQMYEPERLHRVRIAAKKLRYALELAADAGVAIARPLVRALKKIQDTLGRLHDLQVLQKHVAAVQASPKSRRASSDAGLAAIAAELEQECRHLHARYVAAAPALADLSQSARSAVVPALANPRRRLRRPVKMRLRSHAAPRARILGA